MDKITTHPPTLPGSARALGFLDCQNFSALYFVHIYLDKLVFMMYTGYMGNVDKIIQKFKQTNAGQRFEDCEKVLFALGFELKRVNGSHYQYKKNNLLLTIANHKPVAKDAVNDILKLWEKYHE